MSDSKKAQIEMTVVVEAENGDSIPLEINDTGITIVDGAHPQASISMGHADFDRISDWMDAYRRAVRAANGVSDE